MLQSMRSQRITHDLATEQQQQIRERWGGKVSRVLEGTRLPVMNC